jgi:hypothetical protein
MQYKRVYCLLLAAGLCWGVTFSLKAQPQGFDLALSNLQLPDSVNTKQTIRVQFTIKNNGPDVFGGKIGLSFFVSDQLPPAINTLLIPSLFYSYVVPPLAVGDSVEFDKLIFVDQAVFVPGTDNIVIVWPTQIDGDLDTTNNFVKDSIYIDNTSMVTGVAGAGSLSHFSFYPNPAKDFLYVRVPTTGTELSFSIYDILGNKVREVRIRNAAPSSPVRISLKDLPPGVYTLTADDGMRREVKKIVVGE